MNNNNYNSNINNPKILIDNDLQINNIDNQNRKNVEKKYNIIEINLDRENKNFERKILW